MTFQYPAVSRRNLMKSVAAAGLLANFSLTPLSQAVAAAMDDMETVRWTSCVVNCGSRCPLKAIVKNGQVIRIEPENTGADSTKMPLAVPHVRACLRGRSMRQRLYSPERLKYPMKRVGKRGENKFERISWDEALDIVAKQLKYTIEKYGNEAIYLQYGSGSYQLVSTRRTADRLLNMLGGSLGCYGTYSSAQINGAFPYTYGLGAGGSQMTEVGNAKLYVSFGNNTMVTRQSGGGQAWELDCARQGKDRPRMIIVDPIYTDTCLGKEDEWVPIRPGTDAAFVEGMAYVMIKENLVDQAFLDKYCVGYDEKTLPKGAPAKSDYKSYILGEGEDKTPKTPEYASRITGIPTETIIRLAREMAKTKPVFFAQGYGPQRQANGEQTARAIAMLPILTGQVGLPGTSTGMEEDGTNWEPTYLPVGTNPIKAQIPVFLWTDAILRGEQMDWIHDGVKGLEEGKKLGHSIKMIVNSGGNTLINQHGDCNWTDKVLRDDSKCEFIVVCDNMMTPSARYADILLPDTLGPETDDICGNGDSMGDLACIYPMHKAVDPAFDQRPSWEICRGIAKELGLEEQYTEGRDQKGWIKWCYEQTRKDNPELPEFDKFWKAGPTQLFNVKWQPIMFKEFREDPVKNPLKTPSGKIEIYSEALANLSKTWVLPKGDVISALPKFVQTFDMPGDKASKKYPLQCFGYHGHGRTHSTFHNLPWLREVHPDQVLINELDAKARNIADGDKVHVFNDRGCIEVPAHVTKRIMPGVCAVPQGAWYKPVKKDGKTIDVGACINTLTGHRPSPLAKGNPQHSNLVEIGKA